MAVFFGQRWQQARQMRVLAMGNTIIDTVMSMPRIPTDDKVWIDSKKRFVGGQGANAAQGMALLGLSVSWLSRLGDDDDSTWACRHFQSLGMGTEHCILVPGAQTMSATVTVGTDCNSRCCFMHKDPALFDYDVSPHIAGVDLDRFDAIYTDGHQMDLVLPVVKQAAKKGLHIVADIEVLGDETRQLAKLATEVIAPANTIKELAGIDDPGSAALTLADKPGRTVIATAGESGAYGACHGDRSALHVPVHPECKAIDTLGAGDAFHAGFMAAVARGVPTLKERMGFATAVAAALVETPGPVPSQEALRRFGCLTSPN
jgi:sugar/nucleoside kinase (ribokinase family)